MHRPTASVIPLVALAIVGSTPVGCVDHRRSARPPQVAFATTVYDAGTVSQGTRLAPTFAVRNSGGADLSIDNVRTSCDCAATVAGPRVIAPGGAAAIEATCDTARSFGPLSRTIAVYSNDPAQPVTTLTLAAHVDAAIAADPPALYVGRQAPGARVPFDVRLVFGTPTDGPPAAVDTAGRSITVAGPTKAADGTQRLRVAIRPDAPDGPFTDTITVRATVHRPTPLTIPVVGIVDPHVPPNRFPRSG
jgi:hypothetical protein